MSREFFGAYRRNLRNGIPMTIVFLLLGAVLAVDRLYVDQGQSAAAAAFSLGYTLLTLVVASMRMFCIVFVRIIIFVQGVSGKRTGLRLF